MLVVEQDQCKDSLQCPAWNSSGNIKFNRNVHQAAIDTIDILGLDPKTDCQGQNC